MSPLPINHASAARLRKELRGRGVVRPVLARALFDGRLALPDRAAGGGGAALRRRCARGDGNCARGGRAAAAARGRHLAVGPDGRPGAGDGLLQAPEAAGGDQRDRAHLHRRARHRARRAQPAAAAVGPVVSGRRVDVQPRHHRRHGRQQLLRHALDPLRHHARQRAGDRCDPRRRHRGPLRRGRAQSRAACSNGFPSPLRGGVRGGSDPTHRRAVAPHPYPSPRGEGDSSAQVGDGA